MNSNLARVIDQGLALGHIVAVSKLGDRFFASLDHTSIYAFNNFLHCGLFDNAKESRENDYTGTFRDGRRFRIQYREEARETVVTVY